ncbi:thioesterase II family protein [Nocardia sp. CNY236]|uniref:thioesterase II family protein n=1 Tax=Nocardia sp. CNY236 TaxID=1169152 RepID=UPI0003FEEEDE|nr:alpha/beta fold hydrolase [Nocardia sp. CNY236]
MHSSEELSPWLRKLRTGRDRKPTVVCFPPGGGSATSYNSLAKHLRPDLTVYAVQYPGRQDRLGDNPIPSIAKLADHIVDAIAPLFGNNLVLFGHSMGATVAFETARRIEGRGQSITALFVSGRPDPVFADQGRLHRASDSDLIAELERLADDPASVRILRDEPSLAEVVLPAVRNDYQAVETYRYQPGEQLRCNIAALLGRQDPTTTPGRIGEWSKHTTGSFELRLFDGGHFYLDRLGREIADFIEQKLEAAH